MGYRTKTCSYCYGNHSIMDCTKLQEDAKKTQAIIDSLRDKSVREHIFRTIVRRYSYDYKRDTNTHTLTPIKRNTWESYRYTFKKYLGDYEDVANEQAYKDFLSTLPIEISDEEDDKNRDAFRQVRPISEYKHVIDMADKARKSKQNRSNKRCSYCREQGHTSPTCTKKSEDKETFLNAYKTVSYTHLRAH